MSFGREHKYNEMYGGDVISKCKAVKCPEYDDTIDHIGCKDLCCVYNGRYRSKCREICKLCNRPCCKPENNKLECKCKSKPNCKSKVFYPCGNPCHQKDYGKSCNCKSYKCKPCCEPYVKPCCKPCKCCDSWKEYIKH